MAAGSEISRADVVRTIIEEQGIKTVRVTFTDNSGVTRARNVTASTFLRHGLRDGIQYPSAMWSVDTGANFVVSAGEGFARGYPSWVLKPDLDTFITLPWVPGTAKVVADVYTLDGEVVEIAPRRVLARVLDALAVEGYSTRGACELEFYVFKSIENGKPQPSWTGINCYAEVKQQQIDALLTTLSTNLDAIGLQIEEANTEYGPGQFEISPGHFPGVEAADKAVYYKMAVKELMHQMGFVATFMTKPLSGFSGSGSHFHHSLFSHVGENVLYDPAGQHGLSEVARWFIGGQLSHAAALCALANPTINSYRRLRPYSFAPATACWGLENRGTMIRVPHARGSGTHIENRLPGADNNPYLMMAAIYAAGLDGIRQQIEPVHFILGEDAYARTDLPPLPMSLAVALTALQEDTVMADMLGERFVQTYCALKGNEVARFNAFCEGVTAWEVDEYLELF
jgi:glutamine synthetase